MQAKTLLLLALLLVPSFTLHAENASSAPAKPHRLRMEVVSSLPVPVIGKDTPGMESIPGGFEGGSSVKVMVNGKPEYHLVARRRELPPRQRPAGKLPRRKGRDEPHLLLAGAFL
jgi:hypothetical protein